MIDLTPREREIFERYTRRSEFGQRAQLKIGNQGFDIWPDQGSVEDVDWMRAMLAKALAAFERGGA